jgi:DNA repair exonuclease SbcCD ATPase subunit
MKIKMVKAKNFLSFGEEGMEIDFTKLGNIVVIKGQNLDISPQSSNGAGKSTIYESIVYGFYGKIMKGLPNKEVINKKTKKKLVVEVDFEVNDTDYRIIRTRKPDSLQLLRFTKTGEEIDETVGGMPETQKIIESLLRLSADAFINVACIGEHNNHAFLSLSTDERRVIVENLLGLEKYVKFSKQACTIKNAMEGEQKVSLRKYDHLIGLRKGVEDRILQLRSKGDYWKKQRESEIAMLQKAIVQKQAELDSSSDDGAALLAFHDAQGKIVEHKNEIVKLEATRGTYQEYAIEIQPKIDSALGTKQDLMLALKEVKHAVDKLAVERNGIIDQNSKFTKLQSGIKCHHCYGVIDAANYESVRKNNTEKIESLFAKMAEENAKTPDIVAKQEEIEDRLTKFREGKAKCDQKLAAITKRSTLLLSEIGTLSQIKEPNANAKEIAFREQLKGLESRLDSKKEELSSDPYVELISSAETEMSTTDTDISLCKGEIDKRAELLPYYEFWVLGFGDTGIRSFIIDDKLPALNARINYWLQFLIENKLQLNFNEKFEPTIERNPADGDPFVFNATSGGERRRINLSISQAFSHITMMSADIFVDMLSLDEVALNVDLQGVHGIYKMINELALDRRVLVTTHDGNLLDLLENCEVINVVKENGFSRIER